MSAKDETDLRLQLKPQTWYAWEMLPGYTDERYYSPIYLHHVKFKGRGHEYVQVAFHNECYAEGVQGFVVDLRILHWAREYIIGEILNDDAVPPHRCAIICPITWGWLSSHFPAFMKAHDAIAKEVTDPALFMDKLFGH